MKPGLGSRHRFLAGNFPRKAIALLFLKNAKLFPERNDPVLVDTLSSQTAIYQKNAMATLSRGRKQGMWKGLVPPVPGYYSEILQRLPTTRRDDEMTKERHANVKPRGYFGKASSLRFCLTAVAEAPVAWMHVSAGRLYVVLKRWRGTKSSRAFLQGCKPWSSMVIFLSNPKAGLEKILSWGWGSGGLRVRQRDTSAGAHVGFH